MFTVTVLTLSVIVLMLLVTSWRVAVVLLFQADSSSDLQSGSHVESVLLLQLTSDLVPLRFQLSQSSSDKLLLQEGT